MTEFNPEVNTPPTEPDDNYGPSKPDPERNSRSVEFSVEDLNHDYAKGVFMSNARSLQADFVDLYKEDPQATFRLTLERL